MHIFKLSSYFQSCFLSVYILENCSRWRCIVFRLPYLQTPMNFSYLFWKFSMCCDVTHVTDILRISSQTLVTPQNHNYLFLLTLLHFLNLIRSICWSKMFIKKIYNDDRQNYIKSFDSFSGKVTIKISAGKFGATGRRNSAVTKFYRIGIWNTIKHINCIKLKYINFR